jgi:hypothetical protein
VSTPIMPGLRGRVALALLFLVVAGCVAVVAGAWVLGGLGWALVAGGALAVAVGLRADLL